MTSRSAVVYGVGGTLLVACLAAANMPQEREDAVPEPSSRSQTKSGFLREIPSSSKTFKCSSAL
jgi:hypothetical protein